MSKKETMFPNIFQPLKIGPVVAKNRIEVSPAEPFLASRNGLVTENFTKFTGDLAKSGAAIVTIGDSPINQEYAEANHYVINLADPFVVHGLVKVVEEIHRYNALASIELNLRADYFPGDITHQEVIGIIDDFASSAERCKKAGFDMIMLHGGHGHTVAQFFSPAFNKRTDEYGCGTFENRCRFANDLIDAVREVIGPKLAIEYRISGDEKLDPERNIGPEEILGFCQNIQSKIDLLHVSAGHLYDLGAIGYTIQNTYKPRPTNAHLARYIRPHVNIPVTTVGSFNVELAEQAIADGTADMVAMIRTFIADPDVLHKARGGRPEDIRPCLRCNVCTGDDPHGCPKPLRCSINPPQGRQPEFSTLPPIEEPKRVAIVGGGCAGLEAARWLAERGHEPTIYEREVKLGGTLNDAGANAIKSDVRAYAEWSVRTVEKDSRIKVKTGVNMTPELLEQIDPDAVILAIGSEPIVPNLPGIDSSKVIQVTQADEDPEICGHKVIVVGGGITGSECAALLGQHGRDVTIVEMMPMAKLFAEQKGSLAGAVDIARKAGVEILDETALAEVTDAGIVVKEKDGSLREIECDTVVLALGLRPLRADVEAMRDVCEETYVVGDCDRVGGNIRQANAQAFYAAMNI